MKRCSALVIFTFLTLITNAQDVNTSVDCDINTGIIYPLWNDYWELNVQHGYGPNPCFFIDSLHTPFIEDPGFLDAMALLKPRSIRVSIGSFVYLPRLDYASEDTAILKHLPTEFYRGGNSLSEADDPENYYFEYLDSQLDALDSIDAEIFFNIDYMPFTLASNQIPHYYFSCLIPFLQLDNTIRTVPPDNNEVYARVVKNVIRHTKGLFKGNKDYGITYYEIWNEPDHPHNIFFPTFWRGSEYELYDMYEAIINEIENDLALSNTIKIGCCSFAILDKAERTFTENFLIKVRNNNTRLDFLSVHPYASAPHSSLDTSKLSYAQQLIDDYAQGAELINAEWGILDNNALSFVNTLEHEISNLKDVSIMLDRNVTFAHYVNLVEYYTDGMPNLGVCFSDPIRPKVNAVARANINKLLEAPNRLKVEGDRKEYVIAGKSSDNKKVVVSIAAAKPANNQTNTLNIEIQNIPFSGNYSVRVFELSETDFDNEEYFKIKEEFIDSTENLTITMHYNEDQNSGRLYTIILEDITISPVSDIDLLKEKIRLYPNPSSNTLVVESIQLDKKLSLAEISIFTPFGKQLYYYKAQAKEKVALDISNLLGGIYFVKVRTMENDYFLKLIKN